MCVIIVENILYPQVKENKGFVLGANVGKITITEGALNQVKLKNINEKNVGKEPKKAIMGKRKIQGKRK